MPGPQACAKSLFAVRIVGEGFIPPGHFPPPQTATAARGLAALQQKRLPPWGSRFLFADPVDLRQFFGCKLHVLHGLDVIQNLLRLGRTDQNGRDLLVAQQPGQRHFGQGLAAGGGDLIQRADLCDFLRRDVLLLQKTPVGVYAAVGRDAVQVAVRQQALRQRAEGDDALVQLRGGLFQPDRTGNR